MIDDKHITFSLIETCFRIEIISSVTEGVSICYSGICCAEDCIITLDIVGVLYIYILPQQKILVKPIANVKKRTSSEVLFYY